jgi:ABC-type Fe3+ transport system permease subunit
MTRERWIGVLAGVVAVALAIFGVYGDSQAPQNQKDSLWQVILLILVVTALVFGVLLPWAMKRSPEKAGLIVSILGFLSIAAFWSGLPIVLGGAGATLGVVGRERVAEKQGLATAAVAVGCVAAVVGAVVAVLATIHP